MPSCLQHQNKPHQLHQGPCAQNEAYVYSDLELTAKSLVLFLRTVRPPQATLTKLQRCLLGSYFVLSFIWSKYGGWKTTNVFTIKLPSLIFSSMKPLSIQKNNSKLNPPPPPKGAREYTPLSQIQSVVVGLSTKQLTPPSQVSSRAPILGRGIQDIQQQQVMGRKKARIYLPRI